VDSIEGLSPAISIEQKTASRSPRSTVGTVTEIYDYLRLLFSSVGVPHCPDCGKPISKQTPDQIVRHLKSLPEGERVMVLAPIVRGRKGEFKKQLQGLARSGFVRARIDGVLRSLDEPIDLDKKRNHTIEIVVDRLLIKNNIERRLEASVEQAIKLANGVVLVAIVDGEERLYSQKMACMDCGVNIPAIEPRTFSFNSVYGACDTCHGLGVRFDFDPSRIVADPSRPLLQGGLAVTNTWLDDELEVQVRRVAQQLNIDLAVPFEQLSEKEQQSVFYGTREKKSRVTGIIEFLNDQNTADTPISEDLAGFMVTRTCAACKGTRLKPESLAVRVGGKPFRKSCRHQSPKQSNTLSD
jgi:excinuclease ABC subunit A